MTIIQRMVNRLRREVRPFYHSGGRFWCPVCDHSLRGFLPFPQELRDDLKSHGFELALEDFETLNLDAYTCPLCNASDRNRLYALYLESVITELRELGGGRVIEFAPVGELTSKIRRLLGSNFEVRTADLFMERVDDRVDLCDMKTVYADDSVAMFLCSHVLEHIPEDVEAMRELFRILKPGGSGILMVPICLSQCEILEDPNKATTEAGRWRHYGQGDHVRIYSKEGFVSRVSSVGFRTQQFGVSHFGENEFLRCGITPGSVLYVVEKPVKAEIKPMA